MKGAEVQERRLNIAASFVLYSLGTGGSAASRREEEASRGGEDPGGAEQVVMRGECQCLGQPSMTQMSRSHRSGWRREWDAVTQRGWKDSTVMRDR